MPHLRMLPRGQNTSGLAIALIHEVSSFVLAWIAIHDIFGGLSFSTRLIAAALLFVALLLAAASGAVVVVMKTRSRIAGAFALAASVIGAVTFAYLFVYQILNGDYTAWLWIWFVLGIGNGGAVTVLFHAGARLRNPKTFAVAASSATVIALLNFFYSNVYLPSAQTAGVDADIQFGKAFISADRSRADIPVILKLANEGQAGVLAYSSIYSIVGVKDHLSVTDLSRTDLNVAIEAGQPETRRSQVQGYERLQDGDIEDPGVILPAGGNTTIERDLELSLPVDFQRIKAYAEVDYIKTDRSVPETYITGPTEYSWDLDSREHVKDAPSWIAPPGTDYAEYKVPVSETSYLNRQIRKNWVIYDWRVFEDPRELNETGVYVTAVCAPEDPEGMSSYDDALKFNNKCQDRYGLAHVGGSVTERSTAELGLP
jgi:hypothetical protein